ncbi:MAG: hypothetical protein HKP20_11170, partial [Akkermansiaceae bacterium]|nr:hypothetical protein [Akkermansiaceae bacterium]
MLTISTIEVRQAQADSHQETARANARLALMIAIGELQSKAGPDQRVTANAAILEPSSSSTTSPNRNWMGVWKTTYTSGNQEWPLVGKNPQSGATGPYPHKSIYADLRETETSLQNKAWRNELLEGWLVSSSSQAVDPAVALNLSDPNVVQIVGEGTLGTHLTADQLVKRQVLVEKVEVTSTKSNLQGAYGWYVSDNNQKASIELDASAAADRVIPFMATQSDNITAVQNAANVESLSGFPAQAGSELGKIITRQSAGLAGDSDTSKKTFARAFGEHFHNLTTNAPGLFVDTSLGGLRRDLTPLVFGNQNQPVITFPAPDTRVAAHDYSSDFPIIPGTRHAVLGPSFAGLRSWGQLKYLDGMDAGSVDAQLTYSGNDSKRIQPSANWPHGVTDGQTFDASKWSSHAPKLHPVMVESRWHFYFSHTDDTAKQSLRTHIIPRVCLWNPYNVTMKTDELLVMMANPYWRYTNAFHFYFDDTEVQRMKQKYPQANGAIDRWGADGRHKISARGSQSGNKDGLFPNAAYLAFVLEGSMLGPGECLVFSPKVSNADENAGGIAIQKYDRNNISANVLSAKVPQGTDHFFHDYQTTWVQLQTENASGRNSWLTVAPDVFREMRLSEIYLYEPWGVFHSSFPFVLKSIEGSANVSIQDVIGS